jgi:hypothetical protein
MPPTITLGFSYQDGDRVSPTSLHRLVEEATLSGFTAADFDLNGAGFFTYGTTRPTLARGAVHYDTTAGLEGLVYAFASASNASVLGWLYALPHRSCYCWANSAVSAGTPVFLGAPHNIAAGPEFTIFDGSFFPNCWQFSGASGPNACFLLTLESADNNRPVRCMWAGMVPQWLQTLNVFSGGASRASVGSPLFVDFSDPGAFKFGNPSARNLVLGVSLENNATGLGSVIWGTGAVAEDLS